MYEIANKSALVLFIKVRRRIHIAQKLLILNMVVTTKMPKKRKKQSSSKFASSEKSGENQRKMEIKTNVEAKTLWF
jgi:hypothetical protein